jgi:uncharacterized protein (DUF433 family)
MSDSAVEYVVRTPEGAWRINGTRVSLDSVVHAYHDGAAPETIVADFPTLTLELVHGALAFYLRHQPEIDRYLIEQEARWEQLRQTSEASNAELLQRLRASRQAADAAS